MLGKDGDTEPFLTTTGRTLLVAKEVERAINTPARDMCVGCGDLPLRWKEMKVSVLDQPKFGQKDYCSKRFTLEEDGSEKALISFETIVYKDFESATRMLASTVGRMGPLSLSRLEIGDVGVMVEVKGHPSRNLRAVIFIERNVMGLVMLSSSLDYKISDRWVVSMARLMVSRMK